jgi:hypothetical protein
MSHQSLEGYRGMNWHLDWATATHGHLAVRLVPGSRLLPVSKSGAKPAAAFAR